MTIANRNYKDNLFRMIFREKEELLSLYIAINGTQYDDPEELQINTLENAVFLNFKNDISFILEFEMNLYEHQSTYNPNMPLRNLFYIARLLENTMADKTFYSSALVKIPVPRFIVFYNGRKEQPERTILKLSDAFQKRIDEPELELMVTMLNINAGNNYKLQEQCTTLKDYISYVQKVREYALKMPIGEAVEQAVNECMEDNILRKFFQKYKREAIQVSILEYDEEKEMIKIRQSEFEFGVEQGIELENIHVVRRMLEKEMESAVIAEMLELENSYIEQIRSLMKHNEKITDSQVLKLLHEKYSPVNKRTE